MDLHWFPGHMTKSLRMMQKSVGLVDVIFYVLDARAPLSCINPSFEQLLKGKKVVYVLNKCDLVESSDAEKFLVYLKSKGDDAIALDSRASGSAQLLTSIAKRLCEDKLSRLSARGIKASIRAMVIGVPNCGKSTLINNLCGKARALTGNKAGVTRGEQWVRINDYFEVLDTPGTLYPKLSDKVAAARLAYIGSIKDEVVDKNELAYEFIKELNVLYPNALKSKYNLTNSDDIGQIMSDIARSRGFILKGGIPDEDKASIAIIEDFRKGRLGKICLDKESL